jgi:radical SAM protein with 4Fe4S-binding SPASM domain
MNVNELRKYAAKQSIPFSASIELTQNCNFSCKHCYCAEKNEINMVTEEVKLILDKLHDAGCLIVTFTGGEIFTRKDFKELYMYAKDKGFLIVLMTNASLLDASIIKMLAQYKPRDISITLYGTNEHEYQEFTGNGQNYHKTMNALNSLKDIGVPIRLKAVAVRSTVDQIKAGKYDEIARRYHASFYYDPIIFPKHDGDPSPLNERLSAKEVVALDQSDPCRSKEWTTIISALDDREYDFQCTGGVYSLSINHRGEANICGLYRVSNVSLIEHSMDTVWSTLRNHRKQLAKAVKSSECYQCRFISMCKWCPAYALMENNNTNNEKVRYYCDLASIRYETFIKNN